MLEAWSAKLSLSTTIPVGPPVIGTVVKDTSLARDTAQPEVPAPVQSAVNPKKKKSVPPAPALALKNSVQPVQRAAVEVRSCCENAGVVFMRNLPLSMSKVKPKAYCHGVVSAAPVPQSRATPVVGSLKYPSLKAG